MDANATEIARHKTAIRRPSYSLPIKCLLRDGLVHLETMEDRFDVAARAYQQMAGTYRVLVP